MIGFLKNKYSRFLIYLSIIGPGLITAFGDNDAGGITTNSMVGARYGYSFLWVLLIVTIGLTVILEISARLGIVTGKGLMDLIRENFGLRWTMLAVAALYIANMATTTANFAGIAESSQLAGISKYFSVPFVSLLVWMLITRGRYRTIERFLLLLSLVLLSFVLSAFMSKPDWAIVIKQSFIPSVKMETEYIYLIIATVGTTIAPWMIFFLQSMVVDKGIAPGHLNTTRIEIWVSSFLTDFAISFFIIVCCATVLYPNGIRIESAGQAALALEPLAGNYASLLFGIGFFASSTLAIFLLPLTSAYVTCEAFGFEGGLNRKISEAPVFYGILASFLFIGMLIVLLPKLPLFPLIIAAQVISGLLLPIILIFLLKLINDKRIMKKNVNSPLYNFLSYSVVAGIIATTILYVILSLAGKSS